MMIAPSFFAAMSGCTIWHSQWFDSTLLRMIFSNTSSPMPLLGPK